MLEFHKPYSQESGKAYEHGVDEIEIESSQEIKQIAGCQSESGSTEWRHQCCSDSHTRYDITFLLCSHSHYTSKTTDQGYEYVIDGRRSTCQQFRLHFIKRSECKIYCGGSDTEHSSYEITLQRALHKFEIVDTDSKSHTHNRPHKRRNQHGTDDYGSRIDIQSERGNKSGKHKNPQVCSTEFHSIADALNRELLILHTFVQVQIVIVKLSYQVLLSVVKFHNYFFINRLITGILLKGKSFFMIYATNSTSNNVRKAIRNTVFSG